MRVSVSVGGLLAASALWGCMGGSSGFVPDVATARKIACHAIHKQFPNGRGDCSDMAVSLNDGVWYVETVLPPGYVGGGPNVELAQKDGRILNLYLTQ